MYKVNGRILENVYTTHTRAHIGARRNTAAAFTAVPRAYCQM